MAIAGYETIPNRDSEVIAASILVDEENGLFLDLYERQVEVASQHLAPIFADCSAAEAARLLMNHHRNSLGLRSSCDKCEFDIAITEGAFVIIQKPVTYERYLPIVGSPFPEYSGRGVKEYRDVIFFDKMKVQPNDDGELIETEIEIIEFERGVTADRRYKSEFNVIKLNPDEHCIGFLEINDPQVIVKEY